MTPNKEANAVVGCALSRERLARRVDGRNQAKAILELVTLDHPDKIEAFLDELRSTLQPNEVLDEVVSEQRQLHQLAAVTLPRGSHAGERLDEIPRDYLDWWIRDSEELTAQIGEYLEATEHLEH